jgi:hypothetical protein
MSKTERPLLAWATLGLLAALVATNAAFLILLRTGGPLIGIAFYAFLFAVAYRGRQRNNRRLVLGGLIGLVVHAAEVIVVGWSARPALMGLNLALPALLAAVAGLAGRPTRPGAGDE